MIKGIDNKKVEISKEEFNYYQKLIKLYGEKSFENLFNVNNNGIITMITPENNVTWSVLFFIQNLMINQQLRSFEKRIDILEQK